MSQTIVIALFSSRHEGELARGFLDQARVPAALLVDDAGGSEPQLTFVRPARLMVRREDHDLARDVLTEAGYGDVLLAVSQADEGDPSSPPSNGSTS